MDLFGFGLVEVLTVKPGIDFDMTTVGGIWVKRSSKNTIFRRWVVYGPAMIGLVNDVFYGENHLHGGNFASLRPTENSTYPTVSWTNFLPHVGH